VSPYPPSWFDRFKAWVDRLPGPAWVFYLVFGAAVVLAETAIQWREGAYPIATFNPLNVWMIGNFAYLLALMHYLDRSAASAITSFRPLLAPATSGVHQSAPDEATFARLSYQLTTLPARPTLIATLTGVAVTVVVYVLFTANGAVPPYLVGTASTTLSTAFVTLVFVPANAISFVFVYHTIHQLRQISQIYTLHARINIYQLQPLYALSLPGAFTAIGIMFFIMLFVYGWSATIGDWSSTVRVQGTATILFGIAISLFFVTIAGATFALPLLGAHRRLAAAKDSRLVKNSLRFEAAAEELYRQLDGRRLGRMDDLNKALASLEITQGALRRIPTWPWQPGAVRGVLAALFLPLAIWALQLLLGRVLGT